MAPFNFYYFLYNIMILFLYVYVKYDSTGEVEIFSGELSGERRSSMKKRSLSLFERGANTAIVTFSIPSILLGMGDWGVSISVVVTTLMLTIILLVGKPTSKIVALLGAAWIYFWSGWIIAKIL